MKYILSLLILAFSFSYIQAQSCCEGKTKKSHCKEKETTTQKKGDYAYVSTINGEQVVSIALKDVANYTIQINSNQKSSKLADKKANANLKVAAYKMKIPGNPTVSIKGDQVNLAAHKTDIQSGTSIYVFDIEYIDPTTKQMVNNQTNPIVFDIL